MMDLCLVERREALIKPATELFLDSRDVWVLKDGRVKRDLPPARELAWLVRLLHEDLLVASLMGGDRDPLVRLENKDEKRLLKKSVGSVLVLLTTKSATKRKVALESGNENQGTVNNETTRRQPES